jgi:hypothetical protein
MECIHVVESMVANEFCIPLSLKLIKKIPNYFLKITILSHHLQQIASIFLVCGVSFFFKKNFLLS